MKRGLALLVSSLWLSCDATRPPCAEDSDCFLGEQCVQTICVPRVVPDMSQDATTDTSLDQNTSDCRITPGICEPRPCNTTTGNCISCELDAQCGTNGLCNSATGECACAQGFHRCGTQCVSDLSNDSCGDRCAPCPAPLNGFGFCAQGECEIGCNSGWLRCDPKTCDISPLECVRCLSNDNCPASSPVCEQGNCTACRSDADCGAQTELPVCHNGSCVQCTETKKQECNGRTCNPATNTCTQTLIASVSTCERCVSNDDCRWDSEDCVKMKFRGVERPDGYCLYRANEFACSRPYGVRVDRPTISGGLSTSYCTVNEDELTCEALKEYGDFCTKDDDCGAPNLNDGLCKPFSDANRCTFACTAPDDCPPPFQSNTCVTYCRDVRQD